MTGHCWNEERQTFYALVKIGVDKCMCDGCSQVLYTEEHNVNLDEECVKW